MTRTLTTLLVVASVAACSKPTPMPPAANDTAAAPATQQSLSPTPAMGDTTNNGAARATGAPAMAGDTMGARGRAAGTTPPKP